MSTTRYERYRDALGPATPTQRAIERVIEVANAEQEQLRQAFETERSWREDLEMGVKDIIYTLVDKQPAPRSASVTYVAGYARAMDDMKRAIIAIAQRQIEHRVNQPEEIDA